MDGGHNGGASISIQNTNASIVLELLITIISNTTPASAATATLQ
jgi:hypothetical protein